MKPGPPPKPTALKLVQGNPGRRPLPENEPTPVVAEPEWPDELAEDARAEWRRVAPQLLALGMLSKLDRAALSAYCVAWARWLQAEQHIKVHGPIVAAPRTGVPMQNPFLSVANKAMDQFLRLAAEFGMTPSARSRVDTTAENEDKIADKFFGPRAGH